MQIVGCEWQNVCCRSFLLVPSCDSFRQVLITFTTGYPVVLGITTRGGSNFSYKMTFFFHYEEISNFNDYVISVFQLPYNNTSKTHNFFKFAKHVSIDFLQFPAPHWISKRAHSIKRLVLTRQFFQTAHLLTFHVLMHFSMRFLPSKWFFNATIWKFRH